MTIIDSQVFSCMSQLNQDVEHVEKAIVDIEKELLLPHSSTDYYRLFLDLDRAFQPIKQMKETARSLAHCGQQSFERLNKLEGRCPALFGDLITMAVDRQVVEIRDEAQSLQKSLLSENLQNVAKRVDCLKKHISTLCHDNRLSQKNLTVISSIQRFVEMVEKFIEVSERVSGDRPLFAPQRADIRPEMPALEQDPVDAELLMEIFEAAEMFESGHGLAVKKKERLPPALQRRLETIKQQLETSLGFSSERLYATALFALALEMTQGRKIDDSLLDEMAAYYGDLESIEASMSSSRASWRSASGG